MNVTLFGKIVFTDAIKLRISRWVDHPGWSVWALNPMTSVLLENRDWSDAAISPGMPTATRNCESQGRILPQTLWKKSGPTNTMILNFWSPEETKFLLLKATTFVGNLLWLTQEDTICCWDSAMYKELAPLWNLVWFQETHTTVLGPCSFPLKACLFLIGPIVFTVECMCLHPRATSLEMRPSHGHLDKFYEWFR